MATPKRTVILNNIITMDSGKKQNTPYQHAIKNRQSMMCPGLPGGRPTSAHRHRPYGPLFHGNDPTVHPITLHYSPPRYRHKNPTPAALDPTFDYFLERHLSTYNGETGHHHEAHDSAGCNSAVRNPEGLQLPLHSHHVHCRTPSPRNTNGRDEVMIKRGTGATKSKHNRIKSSKKKEFMDHWKNDIRTFYPEYENSTYIIPPVSFYRPSYTTEKFGPTPIKIYTPSKQLSDVRENESQNRVVHALSGLWMTLPQQPMVMARNIVFDNYLNFSGRFPGTKQSNEIPGNIADEPMDISDTESQTLLDVLPPGLQKSDYALFPRPRDLAAALQRGSFGILLIHPKQGLIICESKAIGDTFGSMASDASKQDEHDSITKRIGKALKQLDKEQQVLKYLVSDVDSQPRIRKTLILPNLKEDTLREVLSREKNLQEEFCQCLEAGSLEKALKLCIFSHHLPPIGRAMEADEKGTIYLQQWWSTLVSETDGQEAMTSDVYLSLLARFCGPATSLHVPTLFNPRADVRTLHNAVLETWRCMSTSILYPEEFQLLKLNEKGAFLTGPPGTGKTAMLKYKGAQWASQGHTVYVISLWVGSEAVSCTIQKQIQDYFPEPVHKKRVKLLISRRPQFKDVLNVLEKVLKEGKEKGMPAQRLHLLVDEAPWLFKDFVHALDRLMPGSGYNEYVLWAASVFYGFRPESFKEMKLTRSLRCPPVVVREIQKGPAYATRAMHRYPDLDAAVLSSQPPPTDGPRVKRIQHHQGHQARSVWECADCGKNVARYLKVDLQIGLTSSQERLKYKHVLVSGHMALSSSDETAEPSSGFLKGLLAEKVPFDVIWKEKDDFMERLACPEEDKVQVVEPECLIGLERPVVVAIGTNDINATCPRYVDPWCDVIARCMSQLVVLEDVKDQT